MQQTAATQKQTSAKRVHKGDKHATAVHKQQTETRMRAADKHTATRIYTAAKHRTVTHIYAANSSDTETDNSNMQQTNIHQHAYMQQPIAAQT